MSNRINNIASAPPTVSERPNTNADFESGNPNQGNASSTAQIALTNVIQSMRGDEAPIDESKLNKRISRLEPAYSYWNENIRENAGDGLKEIERKWGFTGSKLELNQFREWFRENKGSDAPWNTSPSPGGADSVTKKYPSDADVDTETPQVDRPVTLAYPSDSDADVERPTVDEAVTLAYPSDSDADVERPTVDDAVTLAYPSDSDQDVEGPMTKAYPSDADIDVERPTVVEAVTLAYPSDSDQDTENPVTHRAAALPSAEPLFVDFLKGQ
ncbi:MAG: hypothetical protein HWE20_04185 [Gammaproteobacteria bacterium]|nr:hypothetical protein [Gammaproteobacteria bacterium]